MDFRRSLEENSPKILEGGLPDVVAGPPAPFFSTFPTKKIILGGCVLQKRLVISRLPSSKTKQNMTSTDFYDVVKSHEDIAMMERSFPASFFLGKTKVVYRPSGSELVHVKKTYCIDDADNAVEMVEQGHVATLTYDPNGNVELDAYVSQDHQFIAIRVLRYKHLGYEPVTDAHFYNGETAQEMAKVLYR